MTERLHFHFHALEKEMATHSSILAWRIPGIEEPSELPSMGSHRVGHDWSDLAAAAAAAAVKEWGDSVVDSIPMWLSDKESACQCRRHRRHGFYPWVEKVPWVGNVNPLWYSCLENPMDRGAWWATVCGVAKTKTWLSHRATHIHEPLRLLHQ